jgi:RNA polymerase sigma factor (sigma-70 family)
MRGVVRRIRRAALLQDADSLSDDQLLSLYLLRRDEAAFEALVRRHGAMVLGVCRRVLANPQDAEDAFQATFLVLVRKAGAVVPRSMLGNWLHGVAYRIAMKARVANTRRNMKERQAARPEPAPAEEIWHDVQVVLDEELDRLPAKYRLPIVLCDLEEKTWKDAARELAWPEGTLATRLSKGRAMLAKRLTRRGVTLSSAALTGVLAGHAAAAVPAPLLSATVQAGTCCAAGKPLAAGVISLKVASLVAGMVKAMLLTKLKSAATICLALLFLGFGAALFSVSGHERPDEKTPPVSGNSTLTGGRPVNDAENGHTDGDSGWGNASGGLRARLIAVAPKTDEQKPDPATAGAVKQFAHAEDLTFLVELQNVGAKPISVQGMRYGDTVAAPWPGKSASDIFAPLLFDCEFFDKDGKPLDRPVHGMLEDDAMLNLSSGLAETIAPGKSLVCLVRPAHWKPGTAWLLSPGEYQARVRYHGPKPAALQQMKKHWPNNPVSSAWTGEVFSGRVRFTIPDSPENRHPELIWGPAVNGLQAAAEYSSAGTPRARQDTASATYPHGTRLRVRFHVRNAGSRDISFWSETWRQDDRVFVTDSAGKETPLGHPWYSGWALTEHWMLKPGEAAILPAIDLGIARPGQGDKDFDHPIGGVLAVAPGRYKLRHELRFNAWKRTGADGQPIPGKDDWQGTLATGPVSIQVRERRADDDPPTFTARLRLRGPDGKSVESGQVEVYRQSGMRSLLKGSLRSGSLEVPGCRFDEPLAIDVRVPGFEKARIYDVAAAPERESVVTLKRAEPLRFRLLTAEGTPVAGARIRYFNRSKFDASSGPYPTDGLHGPVWATSNSNGEVVLDMLQKFDPLDRKLGNNIYWFHVEPTAHAPFFIGPVQAGQDLGKITVSPFLEVSGEVRGTPAELAAFAAEWDQPVPMKRGNGQAGWEYAQSTPLATNRAAGKLTFKLTGLSPGKFRIISRFRQGGKPVSHEYSKRQPNEDDLVFEIELKESRQDIVIANRH